MNLAGILKDALRRLARKEIRAETGKTKQAVAQYRRDIARLKRDMQMSAHPFTIGNKIYQFVRNVFRFYRT